MSIRSINDSRSSSDCVGSDDSCSSCSSNGNNQLIEIHHQKELTIAEVVSFARQSCTVVQLSSDSKFRDKIEVNRRFLEEQIQSGADLYGVTTGFGNSSRNRLATNLALELQRNLVAYHGCGVGELLTEEQCAASLLVRLNCLSRGFSGVSWDLLAALARFAAHRIFPAIPEQGSVGASGDLTPLSYLAAALTGERKVYHGGAVKEAAAVLHNYDIPPYQLKEKEALALMNGTSVMTAIAGLAWHEAEQIANLACTLTGLLVDLLEGRTSPFLSELHQVKPHDGQARAAQEIARSLPCGVVAPRLSRKGEISHLGNGTKQERYRLQDSYSIRCAPQVIGVLYSVLDWTRSWLETELNSVTDNPVVRNDLGVILNGGHFFGGHVAAACDALKTATANVLSLIDKQLAILLDSRLNEGLFPDCLVAKEQLGSSCYLHHGFKAMQITASALTAEALKTSQPMSIFSRSTECLNQDVVSMGTISARELARICTMGKSVVAIYAMAIRQAYFLKTGMVENAERCGAEKAKDFLSTMESIFLPVITDRSLDGEIVQVRERLFATKK